MLNILWGAMLLTGIVYGAITGNMNQVTDAALSSAKEAVSLCITMAGIVAMWVGVMEIAKASGLVDKMTQGMEPLLKFLFPGIPKGHRAMEFISANMIANFLGLGWAATPFGLKAMEALSELEEKRRSAYTGRSESLEQRDLNGEMGQRTGIFDGENGHDRKLRLKCGCAAMPRGVASNEMCTFLILNISSLQLIPVNIIAYRSQYGSVNPTAIVGPGILATAVSTGVAVVFCKVMDRRRRRV